MAEHITSLAETRKPRVRLSGKMHSDRETSNQPCFGSWQSTGKEMIIPMLSKTMKYSSVLTADVCHSLKIMDVWRLKIRLDTTVRTRRRTHG